MFLSKTSTFGQNHLIMLGLSVVIIIVSLILIKKTKMKFSLITTIMLLIWVASELIKTAARIQYVIEIDGVKQIVNAFGYHIPEGAKVLRAFLPRGELPLHLCSVQPFFILYTKFGKNEKIKNFLYEFMFPTCILGGVLAIILVTVKCSFTNPQMYQYFFFHAFIIVYAISIVMTKQVTITFKSIINTISMLLCLAFAMIWINSILSDTGLVNGTYVNFLYLYAPPLSGLPLLNLNNGWYVYFITLIIVAICLLCLLELPLAIKNKRKNK